MNFKTIKQILKKDYGLNNVTKKEFEDSLVYNVVLDEIANQISFLRGEHKDINSISEDIPNAK